MAVAEVDAQYQLGEVLIDDERLVKIATEVQTLNDSQKRSGERLKDLKGEIITYVEQRHDIERDAVFRIGPVTIKKKYVDVNEEQVTRTKQAFSGWKYRASIAKIKREQRRSRASANGVSETTTTRRRRRMAEQVEAAEAAAVE